MSAPAMSARLPLGRKLGYGFGDFGFNLFFTTASLYLLFYYTEVLGLDAATAGWVFAVALIWDALFDPVMGYLANRTRSRWGRYRPYLLFGGIPLAASWVLIFLPVALTGNALVAFAVGAHILFRTLYAVVNMPYLAMSATLTADSAERGVLASIRMVAATTCGLFAAFSTLKLVASFGGGSFGWAATAALYGVVALAFLLTAFASTRETATAVDHPPPSMRAMATMLASNRPFWIVCVAMLSAAIGGTLFSKTLPYYLKYALGREDMVGPALAALTGAVALSMPLWTLVMRRTSKRTMWVSGTLVTLIGYALLWRAPMDAAALLLPLMIVGLGSGAVYLGFWAMMPDTVEYGEWRTGTRSEGAVFGVVSLIQKAALGLAAALLGESLASVGYRANVAQTVSTIAAMKQIMIGGGAALSAFAGAVILAYPIDPAMHRRLREHLAAR